MADICREHYNICRFYKLTIQNKYDKEDLLFFRYVVIVICFYNECKYWKTTNKISYSHQIVIDLSEKLKITGFRYLPRAEKGAPGQIRKYKIYISDGFKLQIIISYIMKTKKTLAMVGIFLFLAIRPSVASSSTERTYLLPTRLEGSCRPVLLLSGTWDFKYSPKSRWTSIQVPGEADM